MKSAAARNATKAGLTRVVAAILVVALGQSVRAADIKLAAGAPRVESPAAGETRTYRVALSSGQAAELSLRQDDAVGIELRWNADGEEPKTFRTEAGRESIVRTTLVADKPTIWKIAVAPSLPDKAFRYSITLTSPHEATGKDRQLAAAAVALAEAETLRGKADKQFATDARTLYRKAVEASTNAGDSCGARHAYVALAGFEHEIVDAAAQKAAAQAALEQPCESGIADRALAERLLGSASINQGDFAAGTRETERAVASFEETGDVYQQGIALRNLGLAYAESGEMEKALAITHRALKAAETVGDGKLLALVRNDLAFMHNARGEFALAVDAYRQTLDTLGKNPYPMAEAVAWINLGIAYGQLGDGDQAMAAYAKGEKVATSIDCWSCLAEIEVDRGDDLLDGGDLAHSEAAYKRALEIAKAHDLVRDRKSVV